MTAGLSGAETIFQLYPVFGRDWHPDRATPLVVSGPGPTGTAGQKPPPAAASQRRVPAACARELRRSCLLSLQVRERPRVFQRRFRFRVKATAFSVRRPRLTTRLSAGSYEGHIGPPIRPLDLQGFLGRYSASPAASRASGLRRDLALYKCETRSSLGTMANQKPRQNVLPRRGSQSRVSCPSGRRACSERAPGPGQLRAARRSS